MTKKKDGIPEPDMEVASALSTIIEGVSERVLGHGKFTYPSDEVDFESLELHELTLKKKKLHRELGLVNKYIFLSKGGQPRFLPDKGTKKTNKSLGPRYRRRETRNNRR